jgi:hypothetical protein
MQHPQRTTAAKQTAALQLLSKIVQLMGLEHLQNTPAAIQTADPMLTGRDTTDIHRGLKLL